MLGYARSEQKNPFKNNLTEGKMHNNRYAYSIRFCIIALILVQACGIFGDPSSLGPPEGSSTGRIPLYPNSESIAMDVSDISSFLFDILGRDALLYTSSTNVSWSEDLGEDIERELNSSLPDDKWRLDTDWIDFDTHSTSEWTKGDLSLFILIFDNIDSDLSSDLERRYGISDLVPGSSLIVAHVIDRAQPLPDLTATAEQMAFQRTSTAEYYQHEALATEGMATANAQSTQAALATADAAMTLNQELSAYSDEFNSPQLADIWNIYRPDPNKWDLTSQPGMLHIVGSPSREAGIINIFGVRVAYSDMEIVTQVSSSNMTNDGQSIWIAFTPDDYSKDRMGYTVELGLAFDNYDGYIIYMWECHNESCWTDRLGREEITYDGPVYLKLVRLEADYFGYYSLDGISWTYVGETRDFSVNTDQVTIGAGGGRQEFDAYFDFIHFAVPGL
jgi:hypothetical protein